MKNTNESACSEAKNTVEILSNVEQTPPVDRAVVQSHTHPHHVSSVILRGSYLEDDYLTKVLRAGKVFGTIDKDESNKKLNLVRLAIPWEKSFLDFFAKLEFQKHRIALATGVIESKNPIEVATASFLKKCPWKKIYPEKGGCILRSNAYFTHPIGQPGICGIDFDIKTASKKVQGLITELGFIGLLHLLEPALIDICMIEHPSTSAELEDFDTGYKYSNYGGAHVYIPTLDLSRNADLAEHLYAKLDQLDEFTEEEMELNEVAVAKIVEVNPDTGKVTHGKPCIRNIIDKGVVSPCKMLYMARAIIPDDSTLVQGPRLPILHLGKGLVLDVNTLLGDAEVRPNDVIPNKKKKVKASTEEVKAEGEVDTKPPKSSNGIYIDFHGEILPKMRYPKAADHPAIKDMDPARAKLLWGTKRKDYLVAIMQCRGGAREGERNDFNYHIALCEGHATRVMADFESNFLRNYDLYFSNCGWSIQEAWDSASDVFLNFGNLEPLSNWKLKSRLNVTKEEHKQFGHLLSMAGTHRNPCKRRGYKTVIHAERGSEEWSILRDAMEVAHRSRSGVDSSRMLRLKRLPDRRLVKQLNAEGLLQKEIVAQTGFSRSSVSRWLIEPLPVDFQPDVAPGVMVEKSEEVSASSPGLPAIPSGVGMKREYRRRKTIFDINTLRYVPFNEQSFMKNTFKGKDFKNFVGHPARNMVSAASSAAISCVNSVLTEVSASQQNESILGHSERFKGLSFQQLFELAINGRDPAAMVAANLRVAEDNAARAAIDPVFAEELRRESMTPEERVTDDRAKFLVKLAHMAERIARNKNEKLAAMTQENRVIFLAAEALEFAARKHVEETSEIARLARKKQLAAMTQQGRTEEILNRFVKPQRKLLIAGSLTNTADQKTFAIDVLTVTQSLDRAGVSYKFVAGLDQENAKQIIVEIEGILRTIEINIKGRRWEYLSKCDDIIDANHRKYGGNLDLVMKVKGIGFGEAVALLCKDGLLKKKTRTMGTESVAA